MGLFLLVGLKIRFSRSLRERRRLDEEVEEGEGLGLGSMRYGEKSYKMEGITRRRLCLGTRTIATGSQGSGTRKF